MSRVTKTKENNNENTRTQKKGKAQTYEMTMTQQQRRNPVNRSTTQRVQPQKLADCFLFFSLLFRSTRCRRRWNNWQNSSSSWTINQQRENKTTRTGPQERTVSNSALWLSAVVTAMCQSVGERSVVYLSLAQDSLIPLVLGSIRKGRRLFLPDRGATGNSAPLANPPTASSLLSSTCVIKRIAEINLDIFLNVVNRMKKISDVFSHLGREKREEDALIAKRTRRVSGLGHQDLDQLSLLARERVGVIAQSHDYWRAEGVE